ncbi:VanW family protein [Janibacter melonis]|uniref:VanW family protein n=1 Tax=Janibacter melonis TaxID=262209 RepID=UPI001E40717C|nr:VanW family protein [Janibacter melonis]MCB5990960.1 VanW family protein [Janibacter melonis]
MSDRRDDGRLTDEELDGQGPRRRGRGVLAGLFVLLVLGALYVGTAVYFGDRVPASTTVGGVSIGGMDESEARAALERGTKDAVTQPLQVEGAGTKTRIDPAKAGLTVDYDASLAGLTGFSLNPADVVAHVRGGTSRDLEAEVDDDALTRAVGTAAKTFEKKPVEGSVAVTDGEVVTKKSATGRAVDRDALVEQISSGWPQTRTYSAKTSTLEPTLAQDEIERFTTEELDPLADGPVKITTTDPAAKGAARSVSFSVPAKELMKAVTVSADKGELSYDVDEAKVSAAVVAAGTSSGTLRPAKDAEVVLSGSQDFSVTPSQSGLSLKKDGVAAPVVAAMAKSGDQRTAAVPSEATKPEVTTAIARKTIPKEEISTFTTYMSTYGPRVENIKLAASRLNGAYVGPGQTFSLNDHLGPRTAAKGYKSAGVIMNGRLAEDYGGGISQLSTTLFNAVFFSGARIEEFHPHSFYISRYPEGREATISYPDVDNRFTNNTKGGILIRANATNSQVTVSFYGVKTWDVEAKKGPRRNVVQPKTITDDSKGCVPQAPTPGFDVTVTRVLKPVAGGAATTSTFDTHYIPEDDVTCTNP